MMKTIGLIANCRKPSAPDVVRRTVDAAGELGLRIVVDTATAELLKPDGDIPADENLSDADVLLTLGGDGTMLRVAREHGLSGRPIMGVNIGKLGFLTGVGETDLPRALDCLARDDVVLAEMALVSVGAHRDGSEIGRYQALNDLVLHSAASGRITQLDVCIDGEQVNSYVCDGLIVSTPAGSTGHSLSAGGPILTPGTRAFVISLICPHTLSSRPLVIPDHCRIDVTVAGGGAMLSVDGQVGQALKQGDTVGMRLSESHVQFVYLPEHSYFSVLRRKLHWSGSAV